MGRILMNRKRADLQNGSVSEQTDRGFRRQPALQIAEGACTVRDAGFHGVRELRSRAEKRRIPKYRVISETVIAGGRIGDAAFNRRFSFEE